MKKKINAKEKRRKKMKRQRRVIQGLGILALVLLVSVAARNYWGKEEDPTVTSSGIAIIHKEEQEDLSAIEQEIMRLENSSSEEDGQTE